MGLMPFTMYGLRSTVGTLRASILLSRHCSRLDRFLNTHPAFDRIKREVARIWFDVRYAEASGRERWLLKAAGAEKGSEYAWMIPVGSGINMRFYKLLGDETLWIEHLNFYARYFDEQVERLDVSPIVSLFNNSDAGVQTPAAIRELSVSNCNRISATIESEYLAAHSSYLVQLKKRLPSVKVRAAPRRLPDNQRGRQVWTNDGPCLSIGSDGRMRAGRNG